MRPLEPHHQAWLASHPERDVVWLRARMADGFDVHHLDGDHSNDAPENLVLIECGDHLMLHNGRTRMSRVTRKVTHTRGTKSRQLHTHLKVRLSERERAAFQVAAEMVGLSLSAWVRMALRERIPTAFEPAAIKPPFAGKGIAP